MSSEIEALAQTLESLLPRISRGVFRIDAPDPLGHIPIAQMRILRLLADRSRTAVELCQELNMTASALTQIANRLQARGLVQRIEDPADRRVRHLTLTGRAADLMSQRRELRIEAASRALSRLDDHERSTLATALNRLLQATRTENDRAASTGWHADADLERPPRHNSSRSRSN